MSTRVFSDADPLGSVSAATIDTEIQIKGRDLRERLMQGGHKFASFAGVPPSSFENEDGKHCVGIDDATGNAGEWAVYDHAGTTKRLRTFGSTHATYPNETHVPGDLRTDGTAGTGTVYGIATGAVVRVNISDAFAVASNYLKRVAYKAPNGSPNRTLTRAMVIVGGRPVGSSLQVEIRRRASADCGVSVDRFTDTNNTLVTTLTLTASSDYAVENTGLSQAIAANDEITIKYGTVGTTTAALDLTILFQIE